MLRKLISILVSASPLYLRALLVGVAAGVEHESILRRMNCRTVIDIGANRGQFSLVSRRCFPNAQIVAFEPLSEPAARYRSVFSGDSRVTLHQVAIGPESGQATMHISEADDSSSLLAITSTQSSLFPGTAEVGTATIKVGRLADFLQPEDIEAPALLKLDVQGYELQSLQGCDELLACFQYIYVECSYIELYAGQALADEVIDFLNKKGFSHTGSFNGDEDSDGRIVQADLLFEQNP
jgi:FkbM family methyltransferase